jgi:UDP-glucose 4-epimerase
VQVAFSDHSKAERVFGARTMTSLEEGLKKMAAWARSTGIQPGKPFTEIEVERGLPPSWRQLLAPTE